MNVNLLIENKIKTLAKERKYPLSKLARDIKMSEPGFHRMLSSGTTKVNTLYDISSKLNVPVSYFLSDLDEKTDVDKVMQVLGELIKERI